ncbi:MAG: helix-turn-helix transcriptional regulator [Actinomycetota bacterium]|nr:helix-turn-helix transcriptional regulator [Actinomycetota bacterium]
MRSYDQYCALARALDHVGPRWALLIVRELLLGPKRFTDLRAGLPGIANNLLADRLRQLQDDGLVSRRELPPPAASSVYELTDAGEELREAVEALIRWGGRWMISGPGSDRFRGDWLALALDALGVGARMGAETDIELIVDGESIRLGVIDGRLTLRDRSDREPQLRVTADPQTVLSVAAGARSPAEALSEVTLEPDGPGAVQAFADIFSPSTARETRTTGLAPHTTTEVTPVHTTTD